MQMRANFSHLFGTAMLPVLEKLIFEGYDQVMNLIPLCLNEEHMDRDIEQSAEVSGFPVAPENVEGASLNYDDIVQGGSKTYTALKYRQGTKITVEMIEDGKIITMKKLAEELGKSMGETRQVVAAGVLNNAFSSSFVGHDGVSLANASHQLLYGGTDSNTASADIGITGLRNAIIAMRDTRNLQGQRRPFRPKRLVVSTTDQFLAAETLYSQLKPAGSTNDVNTLPAIELVVHDYLTDADSWFLLADKHDMNFKERTPVQMDDDYDFDGDAWKLQCRNRFAVGFGDWRGVYGSDGA